jgi:hypothetical protein
MRYATAFVLIEYVSLLVFTVEYGLRVEKRVGREVISAKGDSVSEEIK